MSEKGPNGADLPPEVRMQMEFGGALNEFAIKPKDNGGKFRELVSSLSPDDDRSLSFIGRNLSKAPEALKAHLRNDAEFFSLYSKLAAAELTPSEKAQFKHKLIELSESFENLEPTTELPQSVEGGDGTTVERGVESPENTASKSPEVKDVLKKSAEVAENRPKTIGDHISKLNDMDHHLSENPGDIGKKLGEIESSILEAVDFLEQSLRSGKKIEVADVEDLLTQVDWLSANKSTLEAYVDKSELSKFKQVIDLAEIVSNSIDERMIPRESDETQEMPMAA